jgi:phosphatidylethanolamine/phosphatidyl-N-methylethanolamine N-methyltransferase
LARWTASSSGFAGEPADAVVSGLGLLSMPPAVVDAILRSVFSVLRPGAPLIQFTYGPRCPVPLSARRQHALTAERAGFTLRNIPPASVYVLRKTKLANETQ